MTPRTGCRLSLATLVCASLMAPLARGREVSGDVRTSLQLFTEPTPRLRLTVLTPALLGVVRPLRWMEIQVNWSADVVSGATPRVYGSLDAISSATHFDELRNDVGARVALNRGPVRGYAGYRFGIESDYRSHVLSLGGSLDLAQHNTLFALSYAHGFDQICTNDNRGVSLLLRQPLLDSDGCFQGRLGRRVVPLAIDAAELSWTQTWTTRLVSTVTASYERLDGFQSNPYRAVRLFGGRYEALEAHPFERHRGALAARVRYAVANTRGALAAAVRLYRDSWDLQAASAELAWDQLHLGDRLRWRARVRYHHQSGARFYRDASSASAYERVGPAGEYFTGDRELSPMADVIVGARLWYHGLPRRAAQRIEVGASIDLWKYLPMSASPPNAPRSQGPVNAVLASLFASAEF